MAVHCIPHAAMSAVHHVAHRVSAHGRDHAVYSHSIVLSRPKGAATVNTLTARLVAVAARHPISLGQCKPGAMPLRLAQLNDANVAQLYAPSAPAGDPTAAASGVDAGSDAAAAAGSSGSPPAQPSGTDLPVASLGDIGSLSGGGGGFGIFDPSGVHGGSDSGPANALGGPAGGGGSGGGSGGGIQTPGKQGATKDSAPDVPIGADTISPNVTASSDDNTPALIEVSNPPPAAFHIAPAETPTAGAPSLSPVDGDPSPATVALIDPVPEPGTWALMLAGFGVAGARLRTSRRPRAVG